MVEQRALVIPMKSNEHLFFNVWPWGVLFEEGQQDVSSIDGVCVESFCLFHLGIGRLDNMIQYGPGLLTKMLRCLHVFE